MDSGRGDHDSRLPRQRGGCSSWVTARDHLRPARCAGNAFGNGVYDQNILYEFNDAHWRRPAPPYRPVSGRPCTDAVRNRPDQHRRPESFDSFQTQLGITNATEIGPDGVARPSLVDGDSFTLSNVTETVTFEFDQGFTLVAGGQPVR